MLPHGGIDGKEKEGTKMDLNENELWDIYAKDREKTGRFHRRGDPMKAGEYHLVVHVCIFNSRNQLLIQQRQPFKKGWPNMWDISVGDSALKGESSSQAAERELYEELGIRMELSGKRLRCAWQTDESGGGCQVEYKREPLALMVPVYND